MSFYFLRNAKKIINGAFSPRVINSKFDCEKGFSKGFLNSILVSHQNKCMFNNKYLHSSSSHTRESDIPDYLIGSINKVSMLDEMLETDLDLLDVQDEGMEDVIVSSLTDYAVSYEETETCFIIFCPSCNASSKYNDLFIDKQTGYFVCPWCYLSGNWDDLLKLLDRHENFIKLQEIKNYLLNFTEPLLPSHSEYLLSSSLKGISVDFLQQYGAHITLDAGRLVLPIIKESKEIVGFYSISLIHPIPHVIRRCWHQKDDVITFHQKSKEVIVTKNIYDALHYAKCGFSAVVSLNDGRFYPDRWMKDLNPKAIYFWECNVSKNETHFLKSTNIPLFVLRSNLKQPLFSLSVNDVHLLLKNAIEAFTNKIISFTDLEEKIYYRLLNKEEIMGIKWNRFKDLNKVLGGHRTGELTVISGLTGTGKTTFLSEYSLDLCQQGVKTLWGSFEMSTVRLCEVMLRQFNGKELPQKQKEFLVLSQHFSQIPLYYMIFHGKQPTKRVIKAMLEAVYAYGVQHIVIDNLQFMLGVQANHSENWIEQDKAISAFRQFATSHNCHLLANEMLNIDSISGGARVTQEADNVLLIQSDRNRHKNNKSLHIVKNRFGGQLGQIPLRFHPDSLTYSSHFVRKNASKDKEKPASIRDVKGLDFIQL